jgi:hypothetical protein
MRRIVARHAAGSPEGVKRIVQIVEDQRSRMTALA